MVDLGPLRGACGRARRRGLAGRLLLVAIFIVYSKRAGGGQRGRASTARCVPESLTRRTRRGTRARTSGDALRRGSTGADAAAAADGFDELAASWRLPAGSASSSLESTRRLLAAGTLGLGTGRCAAAAAGDDVAAGAGVGSDLTLAAGAALGVAAAACGLGCCWRANIDISEPCGAARAAGAAAAPGDALGATDAAGAGGGAVVVVAAADAAGGAATAEAWADAADDAEFFDVFDAVFCTCAPGTTGVVTDATRSEVVRVERGTAALQTNGGLRSARARAGELMRSERLQARAYAGGLAAACASVTHSTSTLSSTNGCGVRNTVDVSSTSLGWLAAHTRRRVSTHGLRSKAKRTRRAACRNERQHAPLRAALVAALRHDEPDGVAHELVHSVLEQQPARPPA